MKIAERGFLVVLSLASLVYAASSAHLIPNLYSLLFGKVFLGSSKTLELTLTNTGHAAGTIGSITINGLDPKDFSTVAGGTCTPTLVLQPGKSCILKIAFAPKAVGDRNATLNVALK